MMNPVPFFFLAAIAAMSLTACGGGGGISGGAGSTLPPQPQPSPTTTPRVISGKLVHMTGPLSSQTWTLAAPSGCTTPKPGNPSYSCDGPNNCPDPNTNLPCATYPTPLPVSSLPQASATPGVGPGIGGATVYLTTTAGAITNGVPANPIATATTAPDGTFSVTVSGSSTQYGVVAVNGTSISASSGLTNLGFTVAHADATIGTPITLFVDTLDADETDAFTQLNSALTANNKPPVVADTLAQAAARLAAGTNTFPSASGYISWGGAAGVTLGAANNQDGAYWGSGFAFAPTNAPISLATPAAFAGLAATYATPCCAQNQNYMLWGTP